MYPVPNPSHTQFGPDLVRQGARGGEQAALRLHAEVDNYISSLDQPRSWAIVARIYIDIAKMYKSNTGLPFGLKTLRQFARGFTQRYSLFDLVDLSSDHTLRKIQGESVGLQSEKLFDGPVVDAIIFQILLLCTSTARTANMLFLVQPIAQLT